MMHCNFVEVITYRRLVNFLCNSVTLMQIVLMYIQVLWFLANCNSALSIMITIVYWTLLYK